MTNPPGELKASLKDRQDAGRQLVARCELYRAEQPLVLGLNPAGVAVASIIATALNAPLDIITAYKTFSPKHPEIPLGAVGPNGVRVLDREQIAALGLTQEEVDLVVGQRLSSMQRRLFRYRTTRPMPDVAGKTVLLATEGLETGLSAFAALRALRRLSPRKLVLATPVCPADARDLLGNLPDEILSLDNPEESVPMDVFYRIYLDATDELAISILQSAWNAAPAGQ